MIFRFEWDLTPDTDIGLSTHELAGLLEGLFVPCEDEPLNFMDGDPEHGEPKVIERTGPSPLRKLYTNEFIRELRREYEADMAKITGLENEP